MSKAIPEGWKRVRLVDVTDHIGIKAEPGTVPYIEIGDVSAGKWIYSVKDKPAPIGAIQAIENDICISNVRPTRQAVVQLKEDAAVSAGFTVIRDKGNTEWPFVFQIVKQRHFFDRLGVLATGSTYPTCSPDDVLSFEFSLPPLPEQQKIAAILGSVDKAVEKTRAVIEQTRSLKRAMMQELLTRGIPGRHKKFKKTPVGEIPEEWAVVRLDKLGLEKRPVVRTGPFGSSMKTMHFTASGVPVLTIASLGDGRIIEEGLFYVTEEKAEELSDYKVQEGDLVFSRVADVGRSIVIPKLATGWLISPNLMRICFDKNKMEPHFMLSSLTGSTVLLKQIQDVTADAGRQIVTSQIIKSLTFPLPKIEEQKQIAELLQQLDNRISADVAVLDGFGRMKDALMQNLLSGKIRVEKED